MVCLAAPVKKVEPKVAEKPQKRRVKKDKDAPKKPMPPFFCYQKNRRDNLKNENPTWDNNMLIKVSLGRVWNCAYSEASLGGKRAGGQVSLCAKPACKRNKLWPFVESSPCFIQTLMIVLLCDLDDVRRVEKLD